MSRTLIITVTADKRSVLDENGCEPPPGVTDDGHWHVSVVEGPTGPIKRTISYRSDPLSNNWALQYSISDVPDVPIAPQTYHRQIIGTSPRGEWVYFDDGSREYIGDGDTTPADAIAGKG